MRLPLLSKHSVLLDSANTEEASIGLYGNKTVENLQSVERKSLEVQNDALMFKTEYQNFLQNLLNKESLKLLIGILSH